MTRLAVFETTTQRAYEWLRDVQLELGFDNEEAAYAALRATFHALRDQLGTGLAAHFGAQLPMLLRGLFFEGWDPPAAGDVSRDRIEFLPHLARELYGHDELANTPHVARQVFTVIGMHVTPGEVAKLRAALPSDVRSLWPGSRPAS